MFFIGGGGGRWRCVSFSDRKKSGKPLLMGASGASALAVVAQQCATIPSPTTSQTVNVPSPYSFAVPSVVSWRRLTIFPPPPSSSPPFFDVELMGRKGREINRGFSSPTSAPLPVTAGQVSAGGELPRRETERQRWVRKMRVAVRVRMRERAYCMGAERASGPAQGSAPPADKRSILSISLSALDNKQKFNRPSSCLAFETCGSHMRLHSDPSGPIPGSHLNLESLPPSLK